jgi:tetratricopeptide (TPR) repeat protein
LTKSRSSSFGPWLGATLGALLVAVLAPSSGGAHPQANEQLRALDEKILAAPRDAKLYISRGNVHLDDGETAKALADFDKALELEPSLTVVHYLRAQALLSQGRSTLALEASRRFVELEPESAKGWKGLARASAAVAADEDKPTPEEALAAYDRFFALATDPRPDDYLERAELFEQAGRVDDAVRGLEAGVAKLGPLTALLHGALEIERESGDLESALKYARRLVETSPQIERWLIESARLELALGRREAARGSLDRASRELAKRANRDEEVWQELEAEMQEVKAEIDPPPSAPEGER